MRAAILANNDAIKMYTESIERLAAVEVARSAEKQLTDEEIASKSGAAADEAAGILPPPPNIDPWKAAFSELKSLGLDTVNQLAQGVGNLTQQWVLYGSVGPNAVRKMVASVLSGLAAQAAMQAIMELAYGFMAMTPWGAAIYGPATNHFIAAALFGSVAAGAAIAGRLVAGNSFAASSGGGGGAGGSGGGGKSVAPRKPETTEQNRRNYEPVIHIVMKDGVHDLIEASVVKNWNNNGRIRNVVQKDGG